MKKLLTICLVLILTCALFSCSNDSRHGYYKVEKCEYVDDVDISLGIHTGRCGLYKLTIIKDSDTIETLYATNSPTRFIKGDIVYINNNVWKLKSHEN